MWSIPHSVGVLPGNKMSPSTDTGYNMDEPRKCYSK